LNARRANLTLHIHFDCKWKIDLAVESDLARDQGFLTTIFAMVQLPADFPLNRSADTCILYVPPVAVRTAVTAAPFNGTFTTLEIALPLVGVKTILYDTIRVFPEIFGASNTATTEPALVATAAPVANAAGGVGALTGAP
jgi:hypothetical protein